MAQRRKRTTDAVDILHRRFFEGKPEMLALLEEVRAEDEIARTVYRLRNQSGLSQSKLAKLVGVTATEIDDLEAADYEGNYLVMLRRIANALNKKLEYRFVSKNAKAKSA